MAKLDDGRELPKLPSVEMALLPHEIRAARARTALIAASAAAAVIGGGIVLALPHIQSWSHKAATAPVSSDANGWPSERHAGSAPSVVVASADAATGSAAEPAADPQAADEGAAADDEAGALQGAPPAAPLAAQTAAAAFGETTRITRKFGKAKGFRDALTNGGASAADADAITLALGKLVNFRRCNPEDDLAFERDPNNQLVGFEYRAGMTERYRADRSVGGKFVGKRIEVPVELRRTARGGYVSDSLGRAVEGLGLGTNLASAFVEAFEGKIDFKKHTRAGDSFRLIVDEQIVEGQSLGYGPVLAVEYQGERCGHVTAFWFSSGDGRGDFYDESGRGLHGGWLRTPLRYDHISSPFDPRRRHPILKRIMPHQGVDYAAAPGTAVWAAADGSVTFAGARGANGNLVSIKHPGGFETHYAHLLRISRGIKAGAAVKQRQPIGAVGTTGRSTGPHLHFALKRGGRFIDPQKQLNGPGKPLPAASMPEFKRQVARLKRDLEAIPLAAAPAPAGSQEEQGEVFHEEGLDL